MNNSLVDLIFELFCVAAFFAALTIATLTVF